MAPTKAGDLDPTTDTCSLPYHNEQLLEWFCEKCRKCVCGTCVTFHHRTHPCINMNNPAHMQTVTHELMETCDKVRCEIEKHRNLLGKIQKNGDLRNDKLDKVKHEVKSALENWIGQLRIQEQKIIKDIETTQHIYQENDDSQVEELEKHIKDMETSLIYTEKLASDTSTTNKVIQKEHAVNCCNEFVNMDRKIEMKTISRCQLKVNQNLTMNIANAGTVSLWDCVAEGEGLKRATVGVSSRFTISTIAVRGTSRQTLYNPILKVNVTIQSDYGEVSSSHVTRDNKDGTYIVSFTPLHPGDHRISVIVDGQNIAHCTYTVKVKQCALTGDGLKYGTVGLKSQFNLSLCGSADEKIYDPRTTVKVKIQSPRGNVIPTIHDNKDGVYTVSFVPSRSGHHEISVALDSQDIPDCTHIVKVKQCILKGEGLTNGVVGLKSQFTVMFRGTGDENMYDSTTMFHVKIQSSQGIVIPAIHDNKDGTYLVSFFPVRPGNHRVYITVQNKISKCERDEEVKMLQQEIPGSPFTVTVDAREFRPVLTFGKRGTKQGEFDCPLGVAVNKKDEIIIADCGNHRVQVFSCKGEHLRTIGTYGTGAGEFDKPCGVVSDKDNNIIVADTSNSRVQIFSETGQFIRSFGSEGRNKGQLVVPWGISLDSDSNIIVTERDNNRVQLFINEGKWLKSFDCYDEPRHCVAHGDRYYVSLPSEHCIKVFDKSGKFLCKYGARGSSPGAFDNPTGLAVDRAAHLVVCDDNNHRVQVLEVDGTFVGSFGVRGKGLGQFLYPSSVAVMRDGKFVVCDTTNSRIQIMD